MHMLTSQLNYLPANGVEASPDIISTIMVFFVEGSLGSVLWRSS